MLLKVRLAEVVVSLVEELNKTLLAAPTTSVANDAVVELPAKLPLKFGQDKVFVAACKC